MLILGLHLALLNQNFSRQAQQPVFKQALQVIQKYTKFWEYKICDLELGVA